MAANDPKIRMTVSAPNEVYRQFHTKTSKLGQKHNGVMVRLMELYVRGEVSLEFNETPPPLRKKA
jgi:hypothetical protein